MPERGERDLPENVGGLDRFVRIVGGVILLGLSVFELTGFWHLFVGFFGLYGIITGNFRMCLFNRILGINTVRIRVR